MFDYANNVISFNAINSFESKELKKQDKILEYLLKDKNKLQNKQAKLDKNILELNRLIEKTKENIYGLQNG